MTRFIFFSGKGGVGKTSMACTHAVRYADEGKHILIVTTDPACNSCEMAIENVEDCFGNVHPTCGGCLWAQGLIRCP